MIQSETLNANMRKFCFMERQHTPDGEGGSVTSWTEGMQFSAAVRHDTTILAQQAEGQGTASTYTFLVPIGIVLSFPDVVKRLDDGETFQITSDSRDQKTPAFSGMGMSAVTARKWRLT